MRFEIIIFIIAGAIIANIYTDGKLMKQLISWKKYYKMAGVAFGALTLYWLIRKNPENAKNIIMTSNDYIKYLPIDRSTSSFINPILDFTAKQNYRGDISNDSSYLPMGDTTINRSEQKIIKSGKNTTKRSVSETKKKYVAASQGWMCGNCKKQLPAWFEVDHKVRLEYGGSNHIENLVALCRDCHGEKTAFENL